MTTRPSPAQGRSRQPKINQRYNHPMIEAHLAALHQVSALVRKAGERT
jgi:hypothetical protein